MDCRFRKSDMTPCVIVDGDICYAANHLDQPICVGCERTPEMTGIPAPADFAEKLAAYMAKLERDRRTSPFRNRSERKRK